MARRALPGFRLQGKVTAILQKHAIRVTEDQEQSGANHANRAPAGQTQLGSLGAVDLTVFAPPKCLKSGSSATGNKTEARGLGSDLGERGTGHFRPCKRTAYSAVSPVMSRAPGA